MMIFPLHRNIIQCLIRVVQNFLLTLLTGSHLQVISLAIVGNPFQICMTLLQLLPSFWDFMLNKSNEFRHRGELDPERGNLIKRHSE